MKCEYCNKELGDMYREVKGFCSENCLNEHFWGRFNIEIDEYIADHLDEIAQEYRKELKEIVNERY